MVTKSQVLSHGSIQEAPSPRKRSLTYTAPLRRYPIAVLAAVGIVVSGVLYGFSADAARVALAVTAVAGGLPLVWATLNNMAHGRFHVDTIASLAIVGSVALGQYFAGALVVLMQSGGEALEDYGLRRAHRSLDSLLRRAPSVAHRVDDEEIVDIPARDLQIGDTMLVRGGDIIAADGIVTEGQGSVDEAALTGEPIPLAKGPGDRVYSGAINLSGSFRARTTSIASESKYELIVRMVQQAQGDKAPINRLADRYTPAFTILTLAITAVVLWQSHDLVRALAVLVVATPCPLIIATPLAVLSAVDRAAAMNIIVKSGAAIEEAGDISTVVFDKTGTLTSGEPSLVEVRCFESDLHPADMLLAGAASIELMSSHVLAAAVVKAARARGLKIPTADNVVEAPGTGVSGSVQDCCIAIGSAGFMERCGITVGEEARREKAALAATGRSVAFIASGGRLVGMFVFEDALRPEARLAIQRLKQMGVREIVMLTGDAPENAGQAASDAGIATVHARMQPEDKVVVVKMLAERGAVMMVGDGINDAPALSSASVGVAMGGHGAGIATDAADIVITVENVERVADAIVIGRRMVRVATQGILFGIGMSLLFMVFAGAGMVSPAVGALLQEALDLATILNALRAR